MIRRWIKRFIGGVVDEVVADNKDFKYYPKPHTYDVLCTFRWEVYPDALEEVIKKELRRQWGDGIEHVKVKGYRA